MTTFISSIRSTAITGFFFMLPAVVVMVIVAKAWNALASVGGSLAKMFGMDSIMGIGGASVLTGILMIAICFVCGLLARLTFLERFRQNMETRLAKYIPGYEEYKALAEEKLQNKTRPLPYVTALVKRNEFWQPAYVVEEDDAGNCVVFLPDIPETNRGHIVLAGKDLVKLVPAITPNQLDATLKKNGKGLLTEHGMQLP